MTTPTPRRRRRMQPWEIERAKLKTYQRDRRRQDVAVPGFDYAGADRLLRASTAKLALILRVEREARRCGCATPYPLP